MILENILLVIFLFLIIIYLYGRFIERYSLEKNHIEINDYSKKLKKRIKILHFSDLHFTKADENKLEQIIQLSQDSEFDFCFFTGDLISEKKYRNRLSDLLKEIKTKSGKYAVLGNNDVKKELVGICEKILTDADFKILLNETVYRKEIINLSITGVNDPHLKLDNLEKAAANLDKNTYKILLAHSPEIINKIMPYNFNLILCGHTHGGQINLPFIGSLFTNLNNKQAKEFIAGLFEYEESYIYVNRGIGCSGLPVRIMASPEVCIININTR